MINHNLPHPNYESYLGMLALLLTLVSPSGHNHDAQERIIREKLMVPPGLRLDEERHVIHDTDTDL